MKNPYYDGPVRENFDGLRFSNGGKAPDKNLSDLLRWRFGGGAVGWPKAHPSPFRDHPPERSTPLRVAFVGHATILLQVAGLNILCDPVWSERVSPLSFLGPKRVNEPGIAFGDLPPIDIVLLTHNHYDHMDLATLARLQAAHRPRIVTPLGNDAILKAAMPDIEVATGDWGDRFELSDTVGVTLHPANHWSSRGVRDRRMALWCGFAIETPAGLIYHSGDTGYGDGSIFRAVRERYGAPSLALLPIGAYEPRWFMRDQHVGPDEAVRILTDTGAEQALGFHWGTFCLSNEGIEQPVRELAEALAAAELSPDRFRAMRPGEVFDF